jgi:hypothetical protein
MGKYINIKDPAAPIPEYINIGNRRWSVKEITPQPVRYSGHPPKGFSMRFRLMAPYTQWPAGYAKYISGCQVPQRIMNGEAYGSCMLLTPAWHVRQPALRHLTTTVPFVAVRFSMTHPERRNYWGFWFRSDAERDQCYRESPVGQWLATGHRQTITVFKKETQNDQDNILYAHYGGSENRIQEYQPGGTRLVD